jgi:hypothetical protein
MRTYRMRRRLPRRPRRRFVRRATSFRRRSSFRRRRVPRGTITGKKKYSLVSSRPKGQSVRLSRTSPHLQSFYPRYEAPGVVSNHSPIGTVYNDNRYRIQPDPSFERALMALPVPDRNSSSIVRAPPNYPRFNLPAPPPSALPPDFDRYSQVARKDFVRDYHNSRLADYSRRVFQSEPVRDFFSGVEQRIRDEFKDVYPPKRKRPMDDYVSEFNHISEKRQRPDPDAERNFINPSNIEVLPDDYVEEKALVLGNAAAPKIQGHGYYRLFNNNPEMTGYALRNGYRPRTNKPWLEDVPEGKELLFERNGKLYFGNDFFESGDRADKPRYVNRGLFKDGKIWSSGRPNNAMRWGAMDPSNVNNDDYTYAREWLRKYDRESMNDGPIDPHWSEKAFGVAKDYIPAAVSIASKFL